MDNSKFSKKKENYLTPFRQSVRKARKVGKTTGISEALSQLGMALFAVEEFEQGAENLDLAISLAFKSGNRVMAARHTGTKGIALLEANNMEPAAQCFQQVIDYANESGDKSLKCDALGNVGMVFIETGDAGLALSNLMEAVEIAEELEDLQREMIHVGNLGHAHLLMADIENALICFEKALEISKEIEDKQSQAGYLTNIGVLAVRLDDQEEIIDAFEKVYKITDELEDTAGAMNALNQLIKAHTALDHHQKALNYTQAAQKLAAEERVSSGNPYDKTLVAQLFNLNRDEEGFEQLQNAIGIAHDQADDLRELELLINQGSAYFERRKFESAGRSWEKSLTLSRKLKKTHDQARILGYLAAVQAELGNLKASMAFSHKALVLAKQVEDRRIVGEQQMFLAMGHKDLARANKAQEYCEAAITSFSEIGLVAFEEKSRQFLRELKEAV